MLLAPQLAEKDLIRDLLLDYDKRIRPVKSWSKAVNVTVQPQIYSLVNVVPLRSVFSTPIFLPYFSLSFLAKRHCTQRITED